MEATINRIDDETVELLFTIPAETVDKAISKVYQKISSSQKIHGFRQGKVPRDVIRNMVGADHITGLALEDLLPEALQEAMEKTGIVPIDRPEFDPWPVLEEKKPLEVKTKISVLPEFEICDYASIPVDMGESPEAQEEEIEKALENIRKRFADYVPLIEDRGCVVSDRITVDYIAYEVAEDGSEVEVESREDSVVRLGEGDNVSEVEKHLIGMKQSETKTFDVDFPENYPMNPAVAGKKAKYTFTIKKIERMVAVENDEELLKKLGEKYIDMETLRNDVKGGIEEQKKELLDKRLTFAVMSHVVDGTRLTVPEKLVDEELDTRFDDLKGMLEADGRNIEDFFAESGKTLEEVRAQERDDAYVTVKRRIILNRIFTKENMEILPVEFERAVMQFAYEHRMGAAQVKKMLKNRDFISTIRQRIREAKVSAFLKTRAAVSGAESAPEEGSSGETGKKDAPEADNV